MKRLQVIIMGGVISQPLVVHPRSPKPLFRSEELFLTLFPPCTPSCFVIMASRAAVEIATKAAQAPKAEGLVQR